MPTVVVLNGTSSSGKTTIARALQEISPRLFLNFSIDNILSTLPASSLARIERSADISDIPLKQLVRGFYACVRALLDNGHDLIIDHAVAAQYHLEALRTAISGHDALLVGVYCDAATLRERERARGDRRIGMAEEQLARVHSLLEYDLTIDSAKVAAADAAREILRALGTSPRA